MSRRVKFSNSADPGEPVIKLISPLPCLVLFSSFSFPGPNNGDPPLFWLPSGAWNIGTCCIYPGIMGWGCG